MVRELYSPRAMRESTNPPERLVRDLVTLTQIVPAAMPPRRLTSMCAEVDA